MAIDPPYKLDMFQKITNVHFGNLYLVVEMAAGNGTSNGSPEGNIGVGTPSLRSHGNVHSARILDTNADSNATHGFLNCFVYSPGSVAPLLAWEISLGYATPPPFISHSGFAATHNTCPWPGGGEPPPDTVVVPIAFEDTSEVNASFLYSVPDGDGIVTIDIAGIEAAFSSKYASGGGSGNLSVKVYSTVKGKITKLGQLDSFTEDDKRELGVTSANQGSFKVNIKQDKNPAHAQIDNHGKTFQPYKVTFTPDVGEDFVPPQPPPLLA